jgi:hypothetical protein
MLSNNIMDYYFVAQGKTSIPGVDDGEELTLTDVRYSLNPSSVQNKKLFHPQFFFRIHIDPVHYETDTED